MNYYDQSTQIYLNGSFLSAQSAGINVYSQALHYGYGVFEGIRAYNTHNGSRMFKAEEHFERLKNACDRLHIPFPWSIADLIESSYKLLEVNNMRSAYIRPLVMSGSDMHFSVPQQSNILIAAWEWGPFLGQKLVNLTVSALKRFDAEATGQIQAKISGQYFQSILATNEARSKGFDEALLLDKDGYIAQASSENIFIEKDYKLYTPPLGQIYPGITRSTVIAICNRLNIDVEEKPLTLADLKDADSAFLCGTATEIIGVASVDGVQFPENWTETLGATIQRTYKNLVLETENYEVII
ncbi:branched-chain-amino-acid transaminase [Olivibacter sitiensis]|uniref:branched-chain-amino-acid transaminase n=1 Tax=Olivibacter sitiensis TaxID=376470 RepID=UPI00041E7A7B|nr:branched-chain-amino-acid transaminase [Olivibacter sitiensis]